MKSPCTNRCKIVIDSYPHCIGCGRSRSQIARWSVMSEEEKRKVVEVCKEFKR